ncbi:hypothetical protein LTR05_002177 [Lithohypha guttulata]|uniref:Uncharacterized protein n=1 Tax=Lithohypha guttulata TaxID=1690604 RepID=A0AAN7YHT4_9EURO|nr:hypothetical protein LTR05_002177 [Lithohypha guttulata]
MASSAISAAKAFVDSCQALGDAMAKWGQPENDLYYIKTMNSDSGQMEIFCCTAESDYTHVIPRNYCALSFDEMMAGHVLIYGQDLYYIKTKKTASGNVEIARYPKSKDYRETDIALISIPLRLSDAADGYFTFSNNDLYFIRDRNTESATVELTRWSFKSAFQKRTLLTTTPFLVENASKGQWNIWGEHLYFVQTAGSKTEGTNVTKVILRSTRSEGDHPNYKTITNDITTTYQNEHGKGDFYVTKDLMMYFLKLRETENPGKYIEMHVANNARGLDKEPNHYVTPFGPSDPGNGVFCLDKAAPPRQVRYR